MAATHERVGNRRRIAEHIAGGNSHHCQSFGGHQFIAAGVMVDAVVMDRSVDLDHQFGSGAVKVCDVWPDGVLTAEFDGCLSKVSPKQRFGE